MGKAKKSRAVRVKFAQAKRLLSPKDCRLKSNQEKEETKRKKVRELARRKVTGWREAWDLRLVVAARWSETSVLLHHHAHASSIYQ